MSRAEVCCCWPGANSVCSDQDVCVRLLLAAEDPFLVE